MPKTSKRGSLGGIRLYWQRMQSGSGKLLNIAGVTEFFTSLGLPADREREKLDQTLHRNAIYEMARNVARSIFARRADVDQLDRAMCLHILKFGSGDFVYHSFLPPFRKSGQIGKRIREKAHLLGLRPEGAFAPTKGGASKKRLETKIGRQ